MMTNLVLAGGKAWYLSSEFWVLVPLLLFFALVAWKGGFQAMGNALDKRALAISDELDEARRLREEAQALLASYQRQQAEAEAQAVEIVERARRDAESMAAKARADLAERLQRRAAQAEAKIASAEAQALSEVRSRAADMAVDAARDLIATELTAADRTRLFKEGLSQMDGAMN
ncbi:MAG: F0F1 ATP synthase subunit B [Pseudomonadota bacterium]